MPKLKSKSIRLELSLNYTKHFVYMYTRSRIYKVNHEKHRNIGNTYNNIITFHSNYCLRI